MAIHGQLEGIVGHPTLCGWKLWDAPTTSGICLSILFRIQGASVAGVNLEKSHFEALHNEE